MSIRVRSEPVGCFLFPSVSCIFNRVCRSVRVLADSLSICFIIPSVVFGAVHICMYVCMYEWLAVFFLVVAVLMFLYVCTMYIRQKHKAEILVYCFYLAAPIVLWGSEIHPPPASGVCHARGPSGVRVKAGSWWGWPAHVARTWLMRWIFNRAWVCAATRWVTYATRHAQSVTKLTAIGSIG